MKKTRFTSFDGKELTCFLWDDAVNPKGVIQLVHGLTSHTSRYADFAPRLNAAGYLVFGDDHRMNGHTAGLENLGIAGPTTFDDNVADELAITKKLKVDYGLPVQLFAHSYGSFIAQRYIERGGDLIDGVLLSGSAYMGGRMLLMGRFLTGLQRLVGLTYKPAHYFFNRTFVANDAFFPGEDIAHAWLNRDPEKVKLYNADPYCDFVMTNGFFYALMRGLSDAYKPDNLARIPKELPIRIMSGERDPVGGMGDKVRQLYALYQDLGLNADMLLYPEVRHELTGDPDEDRIIADMLAFFDANLTVRGA